MIPAPSKELSALRYAEGFAQAKRMSMVHETALGWLREGMEILDAGCNTGYLGKVILERFSCVVDGVEENEEAAALAAKVYRRVTRMDLDRESLANRIGAKYDCILALEVIEHLKNPSRVLREFSAALKKNGKLIVSVPNIANW